MIEFTRETLLNYALMYFDLLIDLREFELEGNGYVEYDKINFNKEICKQDIKRFEDTKRHLKDALDEECIKNGGTL